MTVEESSADLRQRMLRGDDIAKAEFFRRCRAQLARDVEALRYGRLNSSEPPSDPVIDRFLRLVAEHVTDGSDAAPSSD
jgi:hypothetical protein